MADLAAELEAALTSAGMLLVWAEKYRYPDPQALPALRRRVLEVGDRARSLARTGSLDESAARELLQVAGAASQDTRRLIDAVHTGTTYRRAVDAQLAGDLTGLTLLLPLVFADLQVTDPPAAAFWTPTWQRRGRPLPVEQIADDLLALRNEGVLGSRDDLELAVDPELPGVVLATTPPLGAPLALRYDAVALPAACLRLGEDQVLLPGDRLRLPFVVALAPPDEPLDEWVADPARFLTALGLACERVGLAVERLPTPAAPS